MAQVRLKRRLALFRFCLANMQSSVHANEGLFWQGYVRANCCGKSINEDVIS